jgi:hypothetical protein
MKEMLREIIAKAVHTPASYTDLTLTYDRGHEMSGMTHFEMREGMAYSLSSDNPYQQTSFSNEGELQSEQRQALLAAIQDSFFDIPPSERNLGDDEVPFTITLSYDDMSYQLDVWAIDGRENPDFVRLQAAFRNLFEELSDGNIILPL